MAAAARVQRRVRAFLEGTEAGKPIFRKKEQPAQPLVLSTPCARSLKPNVSPLDRTLRASWRRNRCLRFWMWRASRRCCDAPEGQSSGNGQSFGPHDRMSGAPGRLCCSTHKNHENQESPTSVHVLTPDGFFSTRSEPASSHRFM